MYEGVVGEAWGAGDGACMLAVDVVDRRRLGHLGPSGALASAQPSRAAVDGPGGWGALPFLALQAGVGVAKGAMLLLLLPAAAAIAALVDKRPERERGVAAVHHHAHALDGLGRAGGGRPAGRGLVPQAQPARPARGAVQPYSVDTGVRRGGRGGGGGGGSVGGWQSVNGTPGAAQ